MRLTRQKALGVPDETAEVAMAHGGDFGSGKAQAVLVHTNVGLANAETEAIHARAANVPMLLFAGRTPTTEKGPYGSRAVPVGRRQQMRDQTALVREACKQDDELHLPDQTSDLVDRALGIAKPVPRSPVYISLPREGLCKIVAMTKAVRRCVPVSALRGPPTSYLPPI